MVKIKHMTQKLFIICIILFFQACNSTQTKDKIQLNPSAKCDGFYFTSKIKYAQGFIIKEYKNYKQVIVLDKWSNDTLTNCIIYPANKPKPLSLPKHIFSIAVPINSVASLSGANIGFLKLLKELNTVKGLGNGSSIFNSFLQKKYHQQEIVDLGTHMNNNFEAIINLSPDLVLKTGFKNVKKNDTRIFNAGIPISYNVEWMENSMLARAEWIKYISCFFCKEAMADSIFSKIESRYNNVKMIALAVKKKPSVLIGQNFKGVWAMPGGRSYMSLLIHDAGGDYYYSKEDKSIGSLRLSLEVVIDKQLNSDIWIVPRVHSLRELSSLDRRYDLFSAFKNSCVYTFNNRISPTGGNDYWESGIANPDIILYDLIKIFHPKLLPNHELFYYKKLQ